MISPDSIPQTINALDFVAVRTAVSAALKRGDRDNAKFTLRAAASAARQQGDLDLERRLCALVAYIIFSRADQF